MVVGPVQIREGREPVSPSVSQPANGHAGQVLLVLVASAAALPWLAECDGWIIRGLLLALFVLCLTGIMGSFRGGTRPLRLLFYCFSLCYIAIPAIYQVAYRTAAWGDTFLYDDRSALTRTLVITVSAYAAFAIAGAGHSKSRSDTPRNQSVRFPRLPVLYLAGAVVLLPLVLRSTGGIKALFTSRTEVKLNLSAAGVSQATSGGVQVALVGILPAALAVAACYALLWRRKARDGRVNAYPLLVVAWVLVLIYSNPFSHTRFTAVAALAPLLFVIFPPRSVRSGIVVTLITLVSLLVVYPAANYFRTGDVGTAAAVASRHPLFTGPDFDGFQQVVNSTIYVRDVGHTHGKTTASAALFFVPRSIWHGKAVPASITVAEHRNYNFTNLSLPVLGEFYLEFGLVGMAALMFAWGRWWRRLDERWLQVGGPSVVPYLAVAQLGALRGPLGSLAPIYVTTALLAYLALATKDVGLRDLWGKGREIGVTTPVVASPVGVSAGSASSNERGDPAPLGAGGPPAVRAVGEHPSND